MLKDEKQRVYRPLECLQNIKNSQAMYYFQSKNPYLHDEGKKIAWITSGGPVEFLIAMNIVPLYPEQYGAIAGSAKDSTRLCQVAESHGYGQDLCAYVRTNFGSIYSPEAPTPLSEIDGIGGLAKPDMLVCGNNICGTVLKWYQDLSRYYKIPLFVLDTPPLSEGKIPAHYIEYISTQIEDFVVFLEKQMNTKMDKQVLNDTFLNSQKAIELWSQILELGKAKPAPLNCADRFLLMAPVVSQRGTKETVSLYKEVLSEVQTRVDSNLGAITVPEEYRLLWDNIPIWFNIYSFFNSLAKKGVVFPADTYTHAWSQISRHSNDILKDAAM
ncbi:MAG: 2-hydroxyacyl-CoA dehydratase, partial [Candidatus Heimdallarchaeota archaeon]|nr:2-hydroxyacyl-CoA dehydratase [Candidatus Heimdallarchaeota archaeon]